MPGAGLEPAWSDLRGIFLPLQLSLLHALLSTCICGLDFTFAILARDASLRQGPSSLYTFLKARCGLFQALDGGQA